MSLPVEKSQFFETDVTSQFAWYVDEAGEEVAWRFLAAVELTLAWCARGSSACGKDCGYVPRRAG